MLTQTLSDHYQFACSDAIYLSSELNLVNLCLDRHTTSEPSVTSVKATCADGMLQSDSTLPTSVILMRQIVTVLKTIRRRKRKRRKKRRSRRKKKQTKRNDNEPQTLIQMLERCSKHRRITEGR